MRLTCRPILIAVVASALSSGVALADTSASIEALRNAPVSAFDLGMFTLNQVLHKQYREDGLEIQMPDKQGRQYEPGAVYNPNTGKVSVYAIGLNVPPTPANWNFASECQQVLTRLRLTLGYNPYEGELYQKPSVMMSYFTDNYHATLTGDIAEVTTVKLAREFGGKTHECSGPLMSNDMQISN